MAKRLENAAPNFYRLYLREGAEGAPTAVSAKLLGLNHGKTVILELPSGSALPEQGTIAELVLFHGGGRVSAETTVAHSMKEPYPHVHLAWPKEVTTKETKRASRRANVELSCRVKTDTGTSVDGLVVNVSRAGLGVRFDALPESVGFPSERVVVILDALVDDVEMTIPLPCQTVRFEEMGRGAFYMGLAIDRLRVDAMSKLALAALIGQSLVEALDEPLFPTVGG